MRRSYRSSAKSSADDTVMALAQIDRSEPKMTPDEEPRTLFCSGAELLPLAKSILQKGYSFRMRATGLSMGRTIQHGELIEVAACEPADLRAGNIAFYQQEDRPMAHRIIQRKEANGALTFLIRGDANRGNAEVVPAEDILGRVTAVHRDDRWQPLPRRMGWCLFGRFTPWTTSWTWNLIHRLRAPAGRVLRATLGLALVRRLLRHVARQRTWRRATPADRVLLASFFKVGNPDNEAPDVVPPTMVEDFDYSDFLLIEEGRRLVGAVGIFPEEDAASGEYPWRLYSMKAHWRYRGRGIGELLLRAAMETVRKEGGSAVTLYVNEANAPAIALYEKYRFRRVARRSQERSPSEAEGPSLIPMELRIGDREVSLPTRASPLPQKAADGRPTARGPSERLIYELLALERTASPGASRDHPEEPFDWDGWLRLVRLEGLGGLFGFWCRGDDQWAAVLPGAVRDRLTQLYYATAAPNLRIFRGVASTISRLRQAGVEVVVLKGAHLAEAVYPSVGCRPMGDVDLLVRPGDFPEAARVLSELGYDAFTSPEVDTSLSVGTTLNASWWNHPDPDSISLHLHWHLRNTSLPYGLVTAVDDERLWADAKGFDLADYATRGLAHHHLLLHLADHAVVHRYDRLILLADMAAVIERYGESLDWALLLDEARSFGLLSSLAMSLQLASRYAAAPVPPGVLETLAGVPLTFPERRMVERFPRCRGSLLWGWLIYGSRCPTWRKRLHYLWLTLQPDPDRLALQTGGATGLRGYLAFCARRLAGNTRP